MFQDVCLTKPFLGNAYGQKDLGLWDLSPPDSRKAIVYLAQGHD